MGQRGEVVDKKNVREREREIITRKRDSQTDREKKKWPEFLDPKDKIILHRI